MPVLLGGSGSEDENPVSSADRFLGDLATIEWASRDRATWISRIDLGAETASIRVTTRDQDAWFGPLPFDADHSELLDGLVRPAGLAVPDPWEPIHWIPSAMDRQQGWRKYWAYLLIDFATYTWALREEPYGLDLERLESAGGGAVVIVRANRRRWITFIPLPPSGETVGMAFEIREWIGRAGQPLAEGLWAKQVDKYEPAYEKPDAWAHEWLRAEGYCP